MTHDLLITVTRSAGDDRAVVVFIDTPTFEPNGKGDSPGLRVLVNDDEAFVGKALVFGENHEAESVSFEVSLDDIPYTGEEGPTTPRGLARKGRT